MSYLLLTSEEQALLLAIVSAGAASLGFALNHWLFVRRQTKAENKEALVKTLAIVAAESFGLKTGLKGPDKLIFALHVAEEAFARVGTKDGAGHVPWEGLIRDLRAMAGNMFPPRTKKTAALRENPESGARWRIADSNR